MACSRPVTSALASADSRIPRLGLNVATAFASAAAVRLTATALRWNVTSCSSALTMGTSDRAGLLLLRQPLLQSRHEPLDDGGDGTTHGEQRPNDHPRFD